MIAKSVIVGELGEQALLLPQRFEEALAANDRVKFYLTILQAAERHASRPGEAAPDFSAERTAAHLAANDVDRLVAEAKHLQDGSLYAPGFDVVRRHILSDIEKMRAPLAIAGVAEQDFAQRQSKLEAALPPSSDDRISPGAIDAMTTGDRDRGDSLHILVMDIHKALNALQGELAGETVDGARAWRILEADRPLVRAFMSGLNETAPLKFDHPGLATTATRAGGRLVIQNDIGTTDAHVLVVHIEGDAATLTYTDIHAPRAEFFQSLFKPFGVRWDEARAQHGEHLAEEQNYHLCVGHFTATAELTIERYLAFLGSRIVFLIDWNKARKRLRNFLDKGDAIRLLRWAANNNIGHRGFLVLGGERLIHEAIEFVPQSPLRYGERLCDALGAPAALDFLKFAFRAASEGLRQGRSERFIRDEVKTELARHFLSAEQNLLALAGSHAELVFELATGLRDALSKYRRAPDAAIFALAARRAAKWEQAADALVARVRSLVHRMPRPNAYPALLHQVDDAADNLEDAAFLLTFLDKVPAAPSLLDPLETLAGQLVDGAQELIKMLAAASHVRREGERTDLQDFLEAVDRINAVEHASDATERAMNGALLEGAPDFRTLHLLSRVASALEQAADALSRTALALRDHLLNDVVAG